MTSIGMTERANELGRALFQAGFTLSYHRGALFAYTENGEWLAGCQPMLFAFLKGEFTVQQVVARACSECSTDDEDELV